MIQTKSRTPKRRRTVLGAVLALLVTATAGCAAAAAGAAAAGTGIYLTTRGAEGMLEGRMQDVAAATDLAFRRLDIERTGERWMNDRTELEIYGQMGENEVTVEIERVTDSTSEVEVRVRESVATWDKDEARRILEEIRERLEG